MRLGENLEVLGLKTDGMGMIVNLVFIWDKNDLLMVDTAEPFMSDKIREQAKKAGVPVDRLSRIIITHHDMDHIGSLEAFVKESGGKINVMAHRLEEPYITGEKLSIKMTPERVAFMQEEMKTMPEHMKKGVSYLFSKRDIKINTFLEDGEELPYCGGIKVIHTPGHTPGHICLYLKKYKALVAGDAMNLEDGVLYGPSAEHSYRIEEAVGSLEKLINYDIEAVICYHGGVYTNDPSSRIKELCKKV